MGIMPTIAGLLFLYPCFRALDTSNAMMSLIAAALLVGGISADLVCRRMRRMKIPIVARALVASGVTFVVWVTLWGVFEEGYIHFVVKPQGDWQEMPGVERFIYRGMSGGGFADGFSGIVGEVIIALCVAIPVALIDALLRVNLERMLERE